MGNVQFSLQRRRKIRVNGFRIDPSNMKLAWWIFQTYPETADNVNVKNQKIRDTYMNLVCSIIGILYHTPLRKITDAKISKASRDLSDLTQAGFKLDWLESKLNKVSLEKQTSEERIVELKVEVRKLKAERKQEKAKIKKRPSWIQVG